MVKTLHHMCLYNKPLLLFWRDVPFKWKGCPFARSSPFSDVQVKVDAHTLGPCRSRYYCIEKEKKRRGIILNTHIEEFWESIDHDCRSIITYIFCNCSSFSRQRRGLGVLKLRCPFCSHTDIEMFWIRGRRACLVLRKRPLQFFKWLLCRARSRRNWDRLDGLRSTLNEGWPSGSRTKVRTATIAGSSSWW